MNRFVKRAACTLCALSLCAAAFPLASFAEELSPATPETAMPATTTPDAAAPESAPSTETETPVSAVPAVQSEVAPSASGLAIGGYAAVQNPDGSLYLAMPNTTTLAGLTLTLQSSEAVDFVASASHTTGNLYVVSAGTDSVTLALDVSLDATHDLNQSDYHITLTTTDHITWTGTFPSTYNFAVSALADALAQLDVCLVAGAMQTQAADTPNEALALVYNQDNATALLVGCEADTALYNVTYTYADVTYTWQLPAGAPLYELAPSLGAGQSLVWYTDAEFTNAVDFSAQTVVSDMTVYGQLQSDTTDSDFATQLDNQDAVLNIKNQADWATFTERSSEITSAQRVELETDITGNGETLTALTFNGSFNGNGHTISGLNFTANGENAGMFASVSGTIANLTLENISVSSATYSGVLAGSLAGTEGHSALVQNVQVRDCGITGRTAGGLAGFAIWAEVRYCSVDDSMRVTGTVNGGGLVGISYANIHDCYANVTPTALLSRGGIAGKNLEGGKVEHCWCTYLSASGQTDSTSTTANNVEVVTSRTPASDYEDAGFSTDVWSIGRGTNTVFTGNVYYNGFAD